MGGRACGRTEWGGDGHHRAARRRYGGHDRGVHGGCGVEGAMR